tara:strand:- start:172 stop:363 length:192 start_codon:yes stop_codon:yes gene_type:complete
MDGMDVGWYGWFRFQQGWRVARQGCPSSISRVAGVPGVGIQAGYGMPLVWLVKMSLKVYETSI